MRYLTIHVLECFSFVIICLLYPFRVVRRKFSQKTNSLWAGTPIINLGINARAERLLGINSKSLVYSSYFATKNFDYNLEKWCRLPVIGKFVSFVVFIWAALYCDRLHFYYDKGLLPVFKPFQFNRFELKVYSLLRINCFFWSYGADVRSQVISRGCGQYNCCTHCDKVRINCLCDDNERMENVAFLRKYATAIFSTGELLEYTPGSRNNLYYLPVELENKKYEPAYPQLDSKIIKIVHAPNHRTLKGSQYLIASVDRLVQEGLPIELILVEKKSNEEALEIYRRADLVFDQCLIGCHGFFALECLAMGKPVMCFIRKPQEYLLSPKECPIINTTVKSLEQDLRWWVNHRDELHDIGVKGRQYMEKYFTPKAFATRLKRVYEELGVT